MTNSDGMDGSFSNWANGHGVIHHSEQTQQRIKSLAEQLLQQQKIQKIDAGELSMHKLSIQMIFQDLHP